MKILTDRLAEDLGRVTIKDLWNYVGYLLFIHGNRIIKTENKVRFREFVK